MRERFSTEVKVKLFVLCFTMFLVMVGFSILFPVFPNFIVDEIGGDARHLGFLFAIYSLIQLIFAPLWGIWSDKRGRKPALLWGLLGIVLTFALIAISTEIWHLFAARVIAGFLTAAALPAVFAFAADITTEGQRGRAIGVIGGSLGMGIVFGPAIGGFFARAPLHVPFFDLTISALRVPFLVGTLLGLINLVLVLLFVTEDKSKLSPSPVRMGVLRRITVALTGHLKAYFVFALLVSLSFASLTSTFALFAKHKFGLQASDMGLIFAFFGLSSALAQGLVGGYLSDKLGEPLLIKIGVPLMAFSFIFITRSPDAAWFTAGACFAGVANGLLFPSIASAISRGSTVGQGGALGIFDSMEAIGRTIGPIAGGILFEMSIPASWDWPYYFGALVLLLSIAFGTAGLKKITGREWLEQIHEKVA